VHDVCSKFVSCLLHRVNAVLRNFVWRYTPLASWIKKVNGARSCNLPTDEGKFLTDETLCVQNLNFVFKFFQNVFFSSFAPICASLDEKFPTTGQFFDSPEFRMQLSSALPPFFSSFDDVTGKPIILDIVVFASSPLQCVRCEVWLIKCGAMAPPHPTGD